MDKETEYKVIINQIYDFDRKTSRMKQQIMRREHFSECAKAYLINDYLDLKKWDKACVLFEHSDLGVEKIFKEIQKTLDKS